MSGIGKLKVEEKIYSYRNKGEYYYVYKTGNYRDC